MSLAIWILAGALGISLVALAVFAYARRDAERRAEQYREALNAKDDNLYGERGERVIGAEAKGRYDAFREVAEALRKKRAPGFAKELEEIVIRERVTDELLEQDVIDAEDHEARREELKSERRALANRRHDSSQEIDEVTKAGGFWA